MSEPRRPTSLADALASYLRQSGFSKRLQQAGIRLAEAIRTNLP